MKIRILQHSASNGCRGLVRLLKDEGHNALRTRGTNSTYRGFNSHLILNWGRSERGILREGVHVYNQFYAVRTASDKVSTFTKLSEEMLNNIPKWTTNIQDAKRLIEEEHEIIYCRQYTRASQGRGIVVAREASELIQAPLYTSKVDVERELRIHVFDGSVIDYAQKKRMSSETREERDIEFSDDVRNLANGWIFAREGVEVDEDIKSTSIKAVQALGLDFGAVDLIVTPQGVSKVLEINTAPGLEGTTLDSYKNAVLRLCNQ